MVDYSSSLVTYDGTGEPSGIYSREMMLVLLISSFILGMCSAQEVPQCTCEQLAPCLQVNADTFFNCGDECQSHTGAMNFDYAAAKQCFMQIHDQMDRAIECFKRFYDGSCATGQPQMVQKRDLEILKLTLYGRLDNMLQQSGIANQVMDFVGSSRGFTNCEIRCISKISPFSCKEQNNCGLIEPSDEVIVNNMVQCAIQNGIDTPAVQGVCHCLAQAGAP
nr:22 upper [Haemonchus contortus]